MKVSMRFEGGADLAKALSGLSQRVSRRVLVDALTEGAEPIRKSAAAKIARRDPKPDIADNIIVVSVPPSRTDDQAAVAVRPAKGFAYGLPLEIGTVDTPAQPSFRPAFDKNAAKALPIVGEVVWRELAGRGISRPTETADVDVSAPDGGDVL